MNENTKYWIWLQQSIGYATSKVNAIRNFYHSVQDFYNGGEKEWWASGIFSLKELKSLYENNLEEAESIIDECERLHYQIITIEDKEYPKNLKEIYDPPCVLYINGRLPDTDNILCIGVVGTRRATLSGKKAAYLISYDLAKAGVVIVSGGALGIDSAAHNGVLEADGKTICVLGCGINYQYLAINSHLRYLISRNGAIISEYPPDVAATKYSFPRRNRIISALSQGLLVVEAGEKSGALITAEAAQSQNRDIFVVPGDIHNRLAYGTNQLLCQGAKPIVSALDILEEYRYKYTLAEISVTNDVEDSVINSIPSIGEEKKRNQPSKPLKQNHNPPKQRVSSSPPIVPKEKLMSDFSQKGKEIYRMICEKPTTLEDIMNIGGVNPSEVMSTITKLELLQLIEKDEAAGKYYAV